MGTVCRVNSCCFGCSLRTGSMIIAIIDMISAFTVLVFAVFSVTDIGHTDYWDRDHGPINGFQIEDGKFIGSNQIFFAEDRSIIGQSLPKFFLEGFLYVLAVMSSLVIISDIVLFIGILGRRYKLVGAWVGYANLNSIFTLAVIIGTSIVYINSDDPYTWYWPIIVFALFYFGFKVYFMMVVWSYAKTLVGGVNYYNGVNVTSYPSALPQAYPNRQQPLYPNENEQNTVDANGQPPNPSAPPQMHPSGQAQMYPNGQPPCSSGQMYPNGPPPLYPSGQQQMHSSVQQTYLNSQVSGQSVLPPPYSREQPHTSLPLMSEIKIDL